MKYFAEESESGGSHLHKESSLEHTDSQQENNRDGPKIPSSVRYNLRDKSKVSYTGFKIDYTLNETESDLENENSRRKKRKHKDIIDSGEDSDFKYFSLLILYNRFERVKSKKFKKSLSKQKVLQKPNYRELLLPWVKLVESDKMSQMNLPCNSFKY